MIDGLIQQFAGGGLENLAGEELHGGVGQLLGAASQGQSSGAFSEALSALGAGGFGQSVAQGAANATPEQRNSLADTLLQAVSHGGGSPDTVLSQLGIGGGTMGPGELGALAQFVGQNHPNALAGVLGGTLGGGSGGSGGSGGGGGAGSTLLHLLGNPMVRQMGMQLAKKML